MDRGRRIAWSRDAGNSTLLVTCTAGAANVSNLANIKDIRSVNMSTTLMMNNLANLQ